MSVHVDKHELGADFKAKHIRFGRTMRASVVIAFVLGGLAGPVYAQSENDGGGTGAVAGEGPGGSGAGQTSGGPQRLKVKKHRPHRSSKM